MGLKEANACKSLVKTANNTLRELHEAFEGEDRTEAFYKFALEGLLFVAHVLEDALCYAPAAVPLEDEKKLKRTLDEVNNLFIAYFQQKKELEQKLEPSRKPRGFWTCPALLAMGIEDVDSKEAEDYCINKCKYHLRCDFDFKPDGTIVLRRNLIAEERVDDNSLRSRPVTE